MSTNTGRAVRRLVDVTALSSVLTLLLSTAALGYTFGSTAMQIGPEQTVYDWSTMACEPIDIPDMPARAFRDASGHVQLIATHSSSGRRMIGPSLDAVRHECRVLLQSQFDADPANYEDREWLRSPYTEDGRTVYALLTDEFQGWRHPALGLCPAPYTWKQCMLTSITHAVSRDGGNSYDHPPAPAHLVAAVPYPYAPGSPDAYGIFAPSNITKLSDGLYYAMMRAAQHGLQRLGTCVMRTRDLSDPHSWRAWDGTGFNIRFINPYEHPAESPSDHVCEPVAAEEIATMADSVTYNTYFQKYLLVGNAGLRDQTGNTVWGFYYSLSDDLIHWSDRKLLLDAPLPWTYHCEPEDPVLFPSILDPSSTARNFDTSDQTPALYFTRSHYFFSGGTCYHLLDRDLDRIPFQFTGTGAAAAAASFTPSTTRPAVGTTVTFDASSSKTVDDTDATYRWDLDGDDTFETDTGTSPIASRSYDAAGAVDVHLRVTDELGDEMEATHKLQVISCVKHRCCAHARHRGDRRICASEKRRSRAS
jgi:hypothetical protein